MGDLTVRITQSVSGFYSRDENCYDRCMGRLSTRMKLVFVWLGYIAIIVSAGVLLLRANIFWFNFKNFQFVRDDGTMSDFSKSLAVYDDP